MQRGYEFKILKNPPTSAIPITSIASSRSTYNSPADPQIQNTPKMAPPSMQGSPRLHINLSEIRSKQQIPLSPTNGHTSPGSSISSSTAMTNKQFSLNNAPKAPQPQSPNKNDNFPIKNDKKSNNENIDNDLVSGLREKIKMLEQENKELNKEIGMHKENYSSLNRKL